jgi:histidine triad (HIT) family protein
LERNNEAAAMSYDPENIFAKIIRAELPAHRVFEDDWTVAFMDLMPQVEGHTLVIPKHPACDLLDAEPIGLGRTIQTTQKIARAVRSAFAADGVMVAQLSGAAAGQTVFHLHFHVLPRYDGVDIRFHGKQVAHAQVLAEHAERIREVLQTQPD